MKIIFSRHAKRRMKWRKISEEEAKLTILESEKIDDSIKGRKNAFKHIGEKWIKITFEKKNDIIIVITAVDKNK